MSTERLPCRVDGCNSAAERVRVAHGTNGYECPECGARFSTYADSGMRVRK
jgi:predicted RNA-binding Zn-ribbon protein involved in translation (DUF1610 family)